MVQYLGRDMMNFMYTKNPYMPKVRRDAAHMVLYERKTCAEVGRHFGVGSSTVSKWTRKAKRYGYHPIPTLSSRPKHHPKELSGELVWKIFHKRLETGRCAEVVYQELKNKGVEVSLSSVKRTLDRAGLLKKRSLWKRFHPHIDRPDVQKPGDLVQMDTIHIMISEKKRIYVFVLLDVYSRWVFAQASEKVSGRISLEFVREAQSRASFEFKMLQSDHGPEFGKWFVSQVKKRHRYTRIGKPNDNAHIERFNRTVQEECLDKEERDVRSLNRALKKYLAYYNNERLHMGINLKTPRELLANRVQGID